MNNINLIGRLTADPEYQEVGNNNTPKANFRLAADRPYTDSNGEQGTDFVPIVCWGKLAGTVNQYLNKGRKVAVNGAIRVDSYNDRSGDKKTWIEVRANNVEFLDSAKNSGKNNNQQNNQRNNNQRNNQQNNNQGNYNQNSNPNQNNVDVPF